MQALPEECFPFVTAFYRSGVVVDKRRFYDGLSLSGRTADDEDGSGFTSRPPCRSVAPFFFFFTLSTLGKEVESHAGTSVRSPAAIFRADAWRLPIFLLFFPNE